MSAAALRRAAIAAILLGSASGPAHVQDAWRVEELAHVPGIIDIAVASSPRSLLIATARGTTAVSFHGNRLMGRRAAALADDHAGSIPHARMGRGTRSIGAAFLVGPTRRYRHGVLGDDVEAQAVVAYPLGAAVPRDGVSRAPLRFDLPADSVFEDLQPRIADLDGDGADEIVLVRSYLDRGAAVAVLGVRNGRLDLLAESQPIGRANRWLNPAGIGDFLGLGPKRRQIAVVETPHIGGVLVVYEYALGRLVERVRRPGYATHVIGSTVLGLAAILDIDGDGADDIVLPTQDRATLVALSLRGGAPIERRRLPLPAPVVTTILAFDFDGSGSADFVFGAADERLYRVRR